MAHFFLPGRLGFAGAAGFLGAVGAGTVGLITDPLGLLDFRKAS